MVVEANHSNLFFPFNYTCVSNRSLSFHSITICVTESKEEDGKKGLVSNTQSSRPTS